MLKGKNPSLETGIEIRKSICTICDPQTQCGVDLYVKDGKIIKVEGSENHPYNKGALCSKGAALRQYIYNEDRIKTPLNQNNVLDAKIVNQFVFLEFHVMIPITKNL